MDDYFDLSDAKRNKIDPKYDPANITLHEYDYSEWYKEKEFDDLPQLEGDEEESKRTKRIKNLDSKQTVN